MIRSPSLTHLVRASPHFVRISFARDPPAAAALPVKNSGNSLRPNEKRRMEETMIPGPFSYHRPATLADAVKLLSTLGDEARPLAGGHSLVPMMKLRLATPEHLVDLHGIDALKGIRRDGNRILIGWRRTTSQNRCRSFVRPRC
jgi:hypothetical protein